MERRGEADLEDDLQQQPLQHVSHHQEEHEHLRAEGAVEGEELEAPLGPQEDERDRDGGLRRDADELAVQAEGGLRHADDGDEVADELDVAKPVRLPQPFV